MTRVFKKDSFDRKSLSILYIIYINVQLKQIKRHSTEVLIDVNERFIRSEISGMYTSLHLCY